MACNASGKLKYAGGQHERSHPVVGGTGEADSRSRPAASSREVSIDTNALSMLKI